MGLFDNFPYSNFHELNLTWILQEIQLMEKTFNDFVSINALKYADPIQWSIVNQYEKNTIVIDPLSGTAYISVQPVPTGISITNTDYWTVVFDLGSFVVRAAKNFTTHYEDTTTLTATFPSAINDWLIWGDTLYRATSDIVAGDQYVIGSNIESFTVEEITGHIQELNTTDKTNLVAAINELLQTISDTVGDLNDLNTTDKTNVVAAINELLQTISDTVGDLNDLNTTDKTNVVAAINEVDNTPRANELSLEYVGSLVSLDSRYLAYSENRYNSVIQGMCINDDGYLVGVRVDESARDNYGVIEVYDTNGNVITTSSSLLVGHGNSITYKDGYYYIGWSTSMSGGVETNSNNISKIKKDFSTTQIITASIQVPAISYDADTDLFYIAWARKLYTFADDTFLTPVNIVTLDEKFFNTTKYEKLTRQNGCYYKGYWIQLYIWPATQIWYDATTGKLIKVYNYPRRLKYNGFSVYEPENIVYNPSNDMFYATSYARCGEGDISTNTFYRFSPFTNSIEVDDRYYQRNGLVLNLFVDPTISDNAYMNGKTDHPFKYIQFAVDYAKEFKDTAFTIKVRFNNTYLGCIRSTNSDNFTITNDTGYTIDSIVTIPSIHIEKSNTIGIFYLNADSFYAEYCSDLQLGDIKVTNDIYCNRVYDAAIQGCSCDVLHLRNSGCSLYNNTFNTFTRTGEVVFKQENIKYFDGGFITTSAVPAGSYLDVPVTYNRASNGIPTLIATLHLNTTNMDILTNMHVSTVNRNTTGATLRICNNDTADHAVGLNWLAFIPA